MTRAVRTADRRPPTARFFAPPTTQPKNPETQNPRNPWVPAAMNPRAWGPPVWKLLHAVAHGIRDRGGTTHNLQRLVAELPHVMPCSLCRNSFGDILKKQGAHVDGPAWDLGAPGRSPDPEHLLWVLHNLVNAKLKRVGGPSFEALAMVISARAAAQFPYVTSDDVWFMLFIFAGCADALRDTPTGIADCPVRQWHFCKFVTYARRALRDAGLLPDIQARMRLITWHRKDCNMINATRVVAQAAGVTMDVPEAVLRLVRV